VTYSAAFVDHLLAAAEPVVNFQRALGEANGARLRREPIITIITIIEQRGRYALLRKINRGAEANSPAPTTTTPWCAGSSRSWFREPV